MYERAFSLQIVVPRGIEFTGEVTSVSAPGTAGAFQILFNHAPFLSTMATGPLKVKTPDGADVYYATSGGVVEVRDNRVVVLAETVERADRIDVGRATEARERAQGRLKAPGPDIDVDRARASLLRALNRLRIAGRA